MSESEGFDEAYAVVGRRRCTPSIIELWLRPPDGPARFVPGQYVLVQDEGQRLPQRSYSIANAPRHDGLVSLLVTRVKDGATSRWLHDEVRVGDRLAVSGPHGTFVDDPTSREPALLLAAGSGLAPIRALAEAALDAGRRRSVTLMFSAMTEHDVIDREWFASWERRYPRFRYCCTLTRGLGEAADGRVPARLSAIPAGLSEHDVFVAGAPGFVRACVAAAEEHGAPRGRVHIEEFFADD